jgi:hypothetical protein
VSAVRKARLAVVAAIVVSTLTLPGTASAHLRTGTVAVDYRARVTSRDSAFDVRVYASDRAVRIAVAKGHTLVVLGYLGEPFIRIDESGVAVNAASPTAASTRIVKRAARSSGSTPDWSPISHRRSIVWHDARVQGLPPGVRHGSWRIPVVVDGRRTQVQGEISRLRRPALWPWLLIVLLFLGASLLLSLGRSRRLVRATAIAVGGLAGIAAVLTATGFALDSYASPGSWIASFDEIVFAAVGFGMLIWARPSAHVAAVVGLGLLSVAVGLSKGQVFFHPLVLSVLPSSFARLCVSLAIGAGTAAAVLGVFSYASEAAEAARRADLPIRDRQL